jgi:hypothetical protein
MLLLRRQGRCFCRTGFLARPDGLGRPSYETIFLAAVIASRDTNAPFQEALEPDLAAAGEGGYVNPGVGPGNNGTKGHDDDVQEQVTLAAVDAWVFEAAEAFAKSEL